MHFLTYWTRSPDRPPFGADNPLFRPLDGIRRGLTKAETAVAPASRKAKQEYMPLLSMPRRGARTWNRTGAFAFSAANPGKCTHIKERTFLRTFFSEKRQKQAKTEKTKMSRGFLEKHGRFANSSFFQKLAQQNYIICQKPECQGG